VWVFSFFQGMSCVSVSCLLLKQSHAALFERKSSTLRTRSSM
jgi:hypothetical protein